MTQLSPYEQTLYDYLLAQGFERDTRIQTLYEYVHVLCAGSKRPSPRVMQQRLGAIITRINRKLEGEKIVPGDVKRTYRLTRTV